MPRHVDVDLRQQTVVDAAWRLIGDEGFDALTIRRLASEIGGATGRVTHYFASKDEILVAVLDELTENHRSGLHRLRDELAAASDADAMAECLVEVLPLDEERCRDWTVWIAFWERAARSEGVAERHRDHYQAWREVLGDALRQIRSAKQSPKVVELDARRLLATIDGLGVHLLVEPDSCDRRTLKAILRQGLD